jgi:hypothetical protein
MFGKIIGIENQLNKRMETKDERTTLEIISDRFHGAQESPGYAPHGDPIRK